MVKKSAINLLPGEFRGPSRVQKLAASLNKTSLVLVSVYLLALLALASSLFFFWRQKATLEAESSQLEEQVAQRQTSEGLLLSLAARLVAAQELFAQTAPAPKIITDIGAILPPGVSLLEVETRENQAMVTLAIPSSTILTDFLATILSQNFAQVKLTSLTNQLTGGYALTLEIR